MWLTQFQIGIFGLLFACYAQAFLKQNYTKTDKKVGGSEGDIFVFAYSWTPEFCYNQTEWPGCTNSLPYWKNYFTLHGLWPQYSEGGYPADCTEEAFDPAAVKKVGIETMVQYWPNVKEEYSSPTYSSFWEHEWTKHGTCTGLSQYDYFQQTINLIQSLGTPAIVTGAVGGTLDADQLRSAFGGANKVSLQCESGSYLAGAFTCWSNIGGVPTAQIVCPDDVQSEDTCTVDTLNVASLYEHRKARKTKE